MPSDLFTGNLAATGDTKVLQFTLTPGADASVTLSGVPPGSDFDLSVYRADRTAIGCPLTRGTGAETVTTQFGSGQTSNTVYVQVSAFSLSANAPNYQVAVQASRASQP